MKVRVLLLPLALLGLFRPDHAGASPDSTYQANDLVMFFRNPNGETGKDSVVTYSLGSTWDVFRRSATPNDPSYGQVISLGNVNNLLTSTYGSDWTSLSSNLFVGAAGNVGATDNESTFVENGDYSRTVYISSPRSGAGTYGVSNSAVRNVPSGASASAIVAGNIDGANSVLLAETSNPTNSTDTVQPQWKTMNPVSANNIVGQAYGGIASGVMGAVSSNTYAYGSVSNVIRGLDLYRITPRTNNGTDGNIAWQNEYSIAKTYGGSGSVGSAYYLGTVTLGSSGDVYFVPVGAGASVDDYTTWAAGYPGATLSNKSADFDGDGFENYDEYAFGTDPTTGNASLTAVGVLSNNSVVSFFRRSISNSQAPTYSVLSTTDLVNPFTTNNAPSISILSNSAPSGYQAAAFTAPASGRRFFQVRAAAP